MTQICADSDVGIAFSNLRPSAQSAEKQVFLGGLCVLCALGGRIPPWRGIAPAILVALLAFPSAVSAHRLDEYLQATLVVIEPGDLRLQINLTPGVAVAQQVLDRIDRDHDGAISAGEAAAYAESLRRDLTVRLDQRKLELKLTTSNFPPPPELRAGTGIIQIEFSAAPGPLAAGAHSLTLENRHLPSISVYLLNAAFPTSRSIRITRQTRNETQSTGEIQFTFRPPARSAGRPIGIGVSLAALLAALSVGVWRARMSTRDQFGYGNND